MVVFAHQFELMEEEEDERGRERVNESWTFSTDRKQREKIFTLDPRNFLQFRVTAERKRKFLRDGGEKETKRERMKRFHVGL